MMERLTYALVQCTPGNTVPVDVQLMKSDSAGPSAIPAAKDLPMGNAKRSRAKQKATHSQPRGAPGAAGHGVIRIDPGVVDRRLFSSYGENFKDGKAHVDELFRNEGKGRYQIWYHCCSPTGALQMARDGEFLPPAIDPENPEHQNRWALTWLINKAEGRVPALTYMSKYLELPD